MSPNQTPLQIYNTRIKDKILREDSVQSAAIAHLDDLHEQIVTAKGKGVLSGLLGKKSAKQGIYLYGGVGRGKSMMMDLFFETLPAKIKARRIHFHAFMIEVHEEMHKARQTGKNKGPDYLLPALAKKIAAKNKVLCFDEFHVTDVADASILGRLFTALFDQGVIVVLTTNWPPDKLYEGGLQRELFLPFIDLVQEKLDVFFLDSPTDYRAETIQQEGSYFYPLGDAAHERMEAVFGKLSLGAPPHKDSFKVKGRKVTVDRVAGGVAWLGFEALCEQPLGAEDYLALAARYQAILLEGVPKMGYDRRNEAKRFMTLIDVLYDERVRLILSADAPPDKLYFGKDYDFEFDRTVSRILEMGSAGYGAE